MQKEGLGFIKAKELSMTPAVYEIITKEFKKILYAEWANPGAMGSGGSARIYVLDGDDLICFTNYFPEYFELIIKIYTLINYLSDKRWVFSNSPSEDLLEKLNDAIKTGKIPEYCFQSIYAGFSNYAWLNTGAGLSLDDNLQGLIFQHNGMTYFIKSIGYKRIKRELFKDLEEFECWRDDTTGHYSNINPNELQRRIDVLKIQLANVKEHTAR